MSFTFKNGIIHTREFKYDENCGGVGCLYFKVFKQFCDRKAQIHIKTDEFDTFSSLLTKCIRTAMVLKKMGFKKGDLIGLCSEKENLNAVVPIIAGQFLGLITFSLAPTLFVDECVDLLRQVQPKMIFVQESAETMLNKSLKNSNSNSEVVRFGKDFEEQFLIPQDGEEYFKPIVINNLEETCVIHFSSGSTGLPKPICLSHYFFLNCCNPPGDNEQPPYLVSLRFSSFYWISSSFELWIYSMCGSCRILVNDFNPDDLWKWIEKYKPTNILLTPLQCTEFSRSKRPEGIDTSCLKNIFTGGYVLHNDYIYALRKMLPGTYIHQALGMTECGAVTTFDISNPQHLNFIAQKPQSCGLPIDGYLYKVIDIETGKKCGPNQRGELYLKGKHIFKTFYNRDASSSFDEEGYFKTGDVVYFDEDFCFYVVDRVKEMIGYKDWVIYPHHIEKVLYTHPSVEIAVVIGIPHKIEGERLMGVVKLKDKSARVTEKELVQFVSDRVQDYNRLREGIIFVQNFPMTATGKISRFKLKQMVLNHIIRDISA